MVEKTKIINKLMLILVCGLFGASSLSARELRTPLSFLYYWWTMYPLERPIDEETCWQFEATGGAYHREADSVFLDKNTTNREPISGTMFGKSVFTLNEAFADATVPNGLLATNPLLNAALISPRIGYSENGAYWGFAVDREIACSCWRVGVRGTLPFRRIEVQLDDCCDLAETLEDVVDVSCDVFPPLPGTTANRVVQNSYAMRLDFLSSLRNCDGSRVFNYGNTIVGNPNRLTNINTTGLTNVANTNFPAHVVKSTGKYPSKPFSAIGVTTGADTTLPDVPFLSSTGNGSLSEGNRAKFNSNTNYTGSTNLEGLKENQRMLWVVPTVKNTNPLVITDGGNDIRNKIVGGCPGGGVCFQGIIDQLGPNDGPINFLAAQGIKFETSRLVGLGDFITQFYANWARDCWFFEGVFGVVWPTAYREKDPGNVLRALFPRGNNKHYEIQVAALGGWERLDWLKIKADALYSYVTPRTERVAGSFAGETVKNIGPATDAKVSWHYFVTDIDFTFIHPRNCDIGLDVGYQAYIKLKDKVRFDQAQGTTLAGTVVNFDPSVIELRTDVVAHKVRMQGFWQGDFFQFFGGWNHVFAGKNATRDTDWYIGASLYF